MKYNKVSKNKAMKELHKILHVGLLKLKSVTKTRVDFILQIMSYKKMLNWKVFICKCFCR